MTISERFRRLCQDVGDLATADLSAHDEADRIQRRLEEAITALGEMAERVGDIPQYKLEAELTPVLLKAHSRIDQCRLMLEKGGCDTLAQRAWDRQQEIYRLLNSL